MAKYRKKPVVINAVQIIAAWFDDPHPNPLVPIGVTIVPKLRHVETATLEGKMIGLVGDWIIRGVAGELYPCKSHIFKATYEPACWLDNEFCTCSDCEDF